MTNKETLKMKETIAQLQQALGTLSFDILATEKKLSEQRELHKIKTAQLGILQALEQRESADGSPEVGPES